MWPIVYKLLLDVYSWRGAFLIQGALMANISVLVLLQTSTITQTQPKDNICNESKHDIDLEKTPSYIKGIDENDDDGAVAIGLVQNHKDKNPGAIQ